ARGKPLDARTDLFSFGVVLYEMATGRHPFRGDTTATMFESILHQVPVAPVRLNLDVPAKLEDIINKCLEKDRNLRYQHASEICSDLKRLRRDTETHEHAVVPAEVHEPAARPLVAATPMVAAAPATEKQEVQAPGAQVAADQASSSRRWIGLVASAAMVIALGVIGWLYWRAHRPVKLADTDTIVLADFKNTTGDPVFEDTLKQALAVGLGQSPFLNVLSDGKVRATLQQMTRSPNERLTEEIAREVCLRAGSKAIIIGSISSLGMQYVIGLNAVNCSTGDSLAREQVQAASKEKVLEALGSASAKLRGELGESLPSVQKFDVPLEQATTPSLEALRAFSLGLKQVDAEAIPLYQRAIELDPNFAEAYARLGISYYNLGQPERGNENFTKAFELREQVSERNKLYIASLYYLVATGQAEKAIQTYQLWTQSYPRDWRAFVNLGTTYSIIGQYAKAEEPTREALRLFPESVLPYENLGGIYLALNRFPEARDVTNQAFARKLDADYLHANLYSLAFVQGDSAEMAKQAGWFQGKTAVENQILGVQSSTEAYFGRLGKAREVTRRAVLSAGAAQNKEAEAVWTLDGALREALFGNFAEARKQADAALKFAPGSRNVEIEAALALAIAGDAARAQALADDLNKRFPLNTVTQSVWLPTIRAQLEIHGKTPSSAADFLQAAVPYELGVSVGPLGYLSCIYPAYVRGEAYLAGNRGAAAAAEFQKILDHRGLVRNCPTAALARLGLGRAYAMTGDSAKARTAYQDFFALWKDADPDVPILKQAKSEYAKLH
ncbi:MAG TPA: tetratricopeptide repeat protein, partial [Candidatus Solibacter sp.]|nr:tetratricopeptide repeat protein [Candidatus Solibacter sp.]